MEHNSKLDRIAYTEENLGVKVSDRLSVLLVDDEQDIVDIFTEELTKRFGLDVDGFTNPIAALDHFRLYPTKYVMIISDVKMPEMNGFYFVREIRKINPDVHVLFITAFEINMAEFAKVLPSAKVDGFIKKPITPSRLADIIRRQLESARTRPGSIA